MNGSDDDNPGSQGEGREDTNDHRRMPIHRRVRGATWFFARLIRCAMRMVLNEPAKRAALRQQSEGIRNGINRQAFPPGLYAYVWATE